MRESIARPAQTRDLHSFRNTGRPAGLVFGFESPFPKWQEWLGPKHDGIALAFQSIENLAQCGGTRICFS
jgi:hypothetical protein